MKNNHPNVFWRLVARGLTEADWEDAYRSVESGLPVAGDSLTDYVEDILLEGHFGRRHWDLSLPKRVFYYLKPLIPRFLQYALRKAYMPAQERRGRLRWPVEDRYARFQFELLRRLMEKKGLSRVSHIGFWPRGRRFAFIITHDVETEDGLKMIPRVVDLEKGYGFRSLFNIVPERYPVDRDYLDSLVQEGFEIGIHGLLHDGKLFLSRRIFVERAAKINEYLDSYKAVGFRSPLTQRNPYWMKELEVEYDMSFFDTDPYETLPGGTMSIWPFFIGDLVELPYTLPQDHTLFLIRGETTPRIWYRKIDFIEQYSGMALVNVHPDYMHATARSNGRYPMRFYEQLLRYMSGKNDYWHALPRDAARWWRRRARTKIVEDGETVRALDLPEAAIAHIPCECTWEIDSRE
jgi:hypothetical protein